MDMGSLPSIAREYMDLGTLYSYMRIITTLVYVKLGLPNITANLLESSDLLKLKQIFGVYL